jgi:DNA polymerase/3'-5' exonuclease PolX
MAPKKVAVAPAAAPAPAPAAPADAREKIIQELDVMCRNAEQEPNGGFRARAYQKVIKQLTAWTGPPIRTMDDLAGVQGIGEKIREKIAEILATGHLAAADELRRDADMPRKELWLKIYGVGPVKAKAISEIRPALQGFADLRRHAAENPGYLNDKQAIGLKYAEHADLRIPRAEMHDHAALVVAAAASCIADSGDIDVLLMLPDEVPLAERKRRFAAVCDRLAADYVTDVLAKGDKKFMGYARLPAAAADAPHRRLDLLLTPKDEYPYAVLYFTGSDRFNIVMRQRALDLGYTLNEHGMKPVAEGADAPPRMREERDIFQFLNMDYTEPKDRVAK